MDKIDFLQKIFSFFRVDNLDLQRTYELALTVKYEVDWNALYKHIIKTTEKRLLPMPKYFTDLMPSYRIYEKIVGDTDDNVIYLELKNGRNYVLTIKADSKTSLEDIKERHKDNIKRIRKFAKGTIISGGKAIIDKGDSIEFITL